MGRTLARSSDAERDCATELDRVSREFAELTAQHAALTKSSRLAPLRIKTLEGRVADLKSQLARAASQNDSLVNSLRELREHVADLRLEVEKLTRPPATLATIETVHANGTVDVHLNGRKMRVEVAPSIEESAIVPGAEASLNDSLNVIAVGPPALSGELVVIAELLDGGERALVVARGDDERVVTLSGPLRDVGLSVGDHAILDSRGPLLLERVPHPGLADHFLEETPEVTYDDIGGLATQIDQIIDAVELPFLHPELFAEYGLPAPKGILLYGPPGCGKTLIAKAVARSLADRMEQITGTATTSTFINIKGPELLNKYVGETERHIRLIFDRARQLATAGSPVVVFFDEMESLFRTRGTGISSDMESTIVPQLLAEVDGVHALHNVIVIGASNREDLIDPAILRPGRLDVKIRIDRPNAESAGGILGRYLTTELPLSDDAVTNLGGGDPAKAVAALIEIAVESIFAVTPDNEFLEVTYQNGDREVMYFSDFVSGAMLENIVRRAKKLAIKRVIAGGDGGLSADDLLDSIRQEFREHEDLPNTTNPDDWAKVSGKKGERITYVRTLASSGDDGESSPSRVVEHAPTGQYL